MEENVEFVGNDWTLTRSKEGIGYNSVLSKQIEAENGGETGVTKVPIHEKVDASTFAFFLNHLQEKDKVKDASMAFQLLRLGDSYRCSSLADKAFDFLTSQKSKNVLGDFKEIMEYIPEKDKLDGKMAKHLNANPIGWKESMYPCDGYLKGTACEPEAVVNNGVVSVNPSHPLDVQAPVSGPPISAENPEPLIDISDNLDKIPEGENLNNLSSFEANISSKCEVEPSESLCAADNFTWSAHYRSIFETEMDITKEMLLCLAQKCFQAIEETEFNDFDQECFESLTQRELEIILSLKRDFPSHAQLSRWYEEECKRRKIKYDAQSERNLLGSIIYDKWSSGIGDDVEACRNIEPEVLNGIRSKSRPENEKENHVFERKKSGFKRSCKKLASGVGKVLIYFID